MIWATVSSWSCFCWLYRASPSLAAKNIINLISVFTIWWCPCVESSLVLLEEGVCYDQCVLLATISLCPTSFHIPRPNLLLKFMSTESMIVSNHLIFCHPFSFCLQSFQALGIFSVSWLFSSGGQSIGASTSVPVLPMNIQDWFPLGLTGLISLLSKGLSRAFSNITVQKHQFFGPQLSLWSNSHICSWLLEKTIALTIWTFVGKVMSLLFNMLSRLVITFLPRSKCLLISWLQSPSAVMLESPTIKSLIVSPSICHEVDQMPWS